MPYLKMELKEGEYLFHLHPPKSFQIQLDELRPAVILFLSKSWGNLGNFGKRLLNINTSRPRSSATLLGRPKDGTKSFTPL